ncbi:MAG: PspC domain-containing protein [Acidimicrobiaceae bacterium]|nr:PspC domain-containing protein [Acidimicrobiaceae bacterium]
MAEEQPPGAEGSSPGEIRDAAAGEKPSGSEESSNGEGRDTMAEEQPAESDEQRPGEGRDAAADDVAATRRILRRSSDDRVIAGVAGGIGAYFGVDAVLVRIAFIVLTFLGGAGPFLYLVGWLALPQEDSRSVVAKALGGDSPRRLRSLAAVVLIGVGLLITANLSGELFEVFINVWTIAPYLALILIAAGVALVLWPGPAGRSEPTPAPPPSGPPPSTAADAGPVWATVAPAGPEPPRASRSRRRGRTTVGYVTVACLLVYTGGAVVLDRLDAVGVDIGVYFAIALTIVGAGLLVSAYAVGARGLILLGVVLSAPLLLFTGAELPWGSGVGEVRVTVTDIDELQDEYRHGVGKLVVDLRGLEPDGTVRSLDLSLSVGDMDIYVPDNIRTTADVNVGAGSMRVWYGGPAPDRQQDLRESRHLLEGLLRLPSGYGDGSGSADGIGTIGDYLDAYERYTYETYGGPPIAPHARQRVARLMTDGAGAGDEAHFRQMFQSLLDEARGSGYPWEDREEGLGVARRITMPVWGEPEGELRLDVDIGIGEAEIVTLPATTSIGAVEP